jgi:hypothetical protein
MVVGKQGGHYQKIAEKFSGVCVNIFCSLFSFSGICLDRITSMFQQGKSFSTTDEGLHAIDS